EWVFPCRRWLSKTKEDRQTRRTLYSRAAEANIAYKVTTFRADWPGAGTLGNVLIQLARADVQLGPFVELRNTSLHDVFEQSQKDMFIIRGRDVGPIREIAVRHATQEGRPWGLAGVIVRNQKTHEEIVFPCREEVDANAVVNLRAQPGAVISIAPGRPGAVISIAPGRAKAAAEARAKTAAGPTAKAAAEARAKTAALEPASKVLFLDHADKSRCHNPYKGMAALQPHPLPFDVSGMAALQPHPLSFDVSVLTSDVKGAGTDANVFIRIFGTIRTSPSIRLAAHALCTTRLFLRGQNDKFRVFLPDVGFITKISLWTDCRNLSDQGGTWHCGKVTINKTVNSDGGQQAYIFPCNREFDGSAGESGGAGNKIDLAPAGEAAGPGV
ncbi:Lipase/lipooxygenase, partial [Baffinella frigidus]